MSVTWGGEGKRGEGRGGEEPELAQLLQPLQLAPWTAWGSPAQVLTFSKGCLRSRFKDTRSSWTQASDTSSLMSYGQRAQSSSPASSTRSAVKAQSAQDSRTDRALPGLTLGVFLAMPTSA